MGRNPRLLLAEDDDDVRWALNMLLDYHGYDVRAVASGVDLLEALARSMVLEQTEPAPDLIIADVRMPGFNGLNTVEALRRSGHRVPLIIISAFGDDVMRRRVAELDAAAFFDKPLNPDALEQAIRSLLGQAYLNRARSSL